MNKKSSLLFLLILISFISRSQTFDWWRNNVNWDGQSHWFKYIMIVPKYLGPNALTVPQINNGSIDSLNSLGISGQFHFSKGDNTQNLLLFGNYTTKNNTIAVNAEFIPYEQFRMSHAIKTERKTYYTDYNKKKTVGDVLVNTTVQLFNKKRDKFQTAIRLGVRMPSGGGLALARFADVPAYWIDLGFAVPFQNSNWKLLANAGFYVWQINLDRLRQTDAFLYGTGLEWNKNSLRLQVYAGGYYGYQGKGDRPLLVRLNLEKKFNRKQFIFRLQKGLHDYEYLTAETGLRMFFRK